MKDRTAIQERFMRDQLPVRLGGLPANLSRIQSFSAHENSRETVASLIEESKRFIEWTAAQAEINTAALMVEVQVQLALWQIQWNRIWSNPMQRKRIAEQSGLWSKQILEASGLLKYKQSE